MTVISVFGIAYGIAKKKIPVILVSAAVLTITAAVRTYFYYNPYRTRKSGSFRSPLPSG